MIPNIWTLTSIRTDQQYAGNRGYKDDVRRLYRYDSKVQNHLNLGKGDVVLIRDRDRLLGLARVESVVSAPGKKTMLRCPRCGIAGLKRRATMRPEFRCFGGHQFHRPQEDVVDVTAFEAHYGKSFADAPDTVPVAQLKATAPTKTDQLSIERVDISKLQRLLLSAYPRTHEVLSRFFRGARVRPDDADEKPGPQKDSYVGGNADTRKTATLAIKLRRGQRKFRNALIKRYGARCAVTGCEVLDILEAAHIRPYRGDADNHPENGLLLRADIHTLFDLDLMSIDPDSLTVRVAPALKVDTGYAAMHGKPLRVSASVRPALDPLRNRWAAFCLTWKLSVT
jgi:putative restriction endonuclease